MEPDMMEQNGIVEQKVILKDEVRIIGIDDAPFDKNSSQEKARVIATFFRGGLFLDGVLSCEVDVDGKDSTEKICRMVNSSKFVSQVNAIILDGIAVAGFNVIDIQKLNRLTSIPVLVVIRRMPDIPNIIHTLEKLGMEDKNRLIENAGEVHQHKKIFYQTAGCSIDLAEEILRITCTRSDIPEPVRVAHLIGQGLVFGESHGNA